MKIRVEENENESVDLTVLKNSYKLFHPIGVNEKWGQVSCSLAAAYHRMEKVWPLSDF